MERLFLFLFDFFNKQRLIFIIFVVGISAASLYYASKIKLEEDITKFIPKDAKVDKVNNVFQNMKFKDKVIVNISLSDTNSKANPDQLILYANKFVEEIKTKYYPDYIKEITFKMSSDMMFDTYNLFYENLPVFLDKSDYTKIDAIIQDSNIEKTLSKDFKTLISPASFALKNFIKRDPLNITPIALQKLQSIKVDDSFEVYNDYIFTKNHKNLVLFIIPANASSETSKNTTLVEGLDGIIKNIGKESNDKISIKYYGGIAFAVGNASQLKEDSILTLSLAIVLILAFILYFFKSKRAPVVIFIPVLFGAAFSIAMLYLIKGKVSSMAVGSGSIVLGIAINYSLHVYSHYRHTGNIREVIRDLSYPLTIGGFTTIGAFLCLLFVKSEALQDFGLFSAFSLIGSALFSLIVMPHLIKSKKIEDSHDHLKLNFLDKLSEVRLDNKPIFLIIVFLLTIVFWFTSKNVGFESDLSKINYVSEDLQKTEKELDRINDVSAKSVFLVSTGKDLNDAIRINEKAIETLEKLQKDKTIKRYYSVNAILLSEAEQKDRIAQWNSYWTKEKADNLKRKLIDIGKKYKFKEAAFEDFYQLLDKNFKTINPESFGEIKKILLDEWITETNGMTMVTTIVKVAQKDKDKVYQAFANNNDVVIFDKQNLATKFIDIISSDFNLILILSSLLVFFTLLVSYGRIELALITFIPMLISWIWILGLMGIFGLKFNIINIIISTFIFGLGDDYSIFIMDGLLSEYKTGKKVLASYKTAIFLSAITAIIGLGVLLFAKHPAFKSIALITIIGMFSVVIISYTLIPLLFNFLMYSNKKKRTVPVTFLNIFYSIFAFLLYFGGSFLMSIIGITMFKLLPVKRKTRQKMLHYLMMYFGKFIIYVMVNVKKTIFNPSKEDFSKPAVIICNHQSHIDILLMLMLHPKIFLLTNDWVQKNIFYGRLVKYADFFPVSSGLDKNLPILAQKVKEGFSIVVFPEGSRSVDSEVKRFHKGAFYIAEQLNLDIVPIVIHGVGYTLTKGELLLKSGRITMKILPRIKHDDISFGIGYSDKAKGIQKYFRNEFEKIREERETVKYYKDILIKNFLYKGPLLEWYMRVKLKLEGYYEIYNRIIPREGVITDIGCGYGFNVYMLGLTSRNRVLTGIDYDEEKIEIANNCNAKTKNIRFICDDITTCKFSKSDVFILSDVLHYLKSEDQDKIIIKCIENLNFNGILIIRDGNTEMKKRHFFTRTTEIFSTNFGFNKAVNKLCFISRSKIEKIALDHNCTIKTFDKSVFTSNIFYVIKKKNGDNR